MKIKLEDATATQLAQYATETLNLPNMMHTKGRNVLMAEIRRIGEIEFIEIGDDPTGVVSVDDEPEETKKARDPDQLVEIKIPQQEGPGGNEPVFTAVNGVTLWIPRDEWCEVKYRYVEVLQNAVKTLYETDDDNKIVSEREVPQHPILLKVAA